MKKRNKAEDISGRFLDFLKISFDGVNLLRGITFQKLKPDPKEK